jgi:diadenosine tetraphosphate (Ap4A) HIT family hydrolase
MNLDCIFCKIINKQISSQIVAENNELLVIKDAAPKASTHYLIMPKTHVPDLMGLDQKSFHIGALVVQMAQELAQKLPGQPSAFRLISNNGAGAGQSVFHLHFHFLAGQNLPGF